MLSGSNVYLTISGEGLRVGGNGRMGVTNNQFVELSLDGHLWQTVSVNWMCEINCALGWLPDVPLGAQQFRYLRLRTTFHHGDHRVNFDTVRVWNVEVVPLTLQVLEGDYQQTVKQLTLNPAGWPTPNPLVSEVTLSCPPGTQACTDPFHFYLDSSGPARFYVFEQDQSELQTGNCAPFSTNNPTSFTWYEAACDLTIYPGTAATLRWWTWVQPSEAVTLSVRADWGGEMLEERISVPQANIKPLVFLPGFLGTYPPASDGALDPLAKLYDNLIEALQRAGYERGSAGSGASLVIFGYDWRQNLGDLGRVNLAQTVNNLLSTPATLQKPYVVYTQTDMMGHSTGGIIARAFVEDAGASNEQKVNRLITIASPHKGLPPAYRGWYGGQVDGLGLDEGRVTAILGGLAICDDTLDLDEWNKMRDDTYFQTAMYTYIREYMPSIKDFLPTNDIPLPYLVRNQVPYTDYYPHLRPNSPFLEDLNDLSGDYEVSKLGGVAEVVAIFSTDYLPEAQYKVDPSPISFPWEGWWGHGEVVGTGKRIFIINSIKGDSFVPTYSANLKMVTALSKTTNITIRDESNIPVSKGGFTKTHHISLVYGPDMIRRLISETTKINLTLYEGFWNTKYVEPTASSALWAIITCSPVRTLVTNPAGKQIGLDNNTGQIVNDIQYGIVSLEGTEPHLILLPEIPGEYQVEGVGIGNGRYKVAAVRIGPDGTPQLGGYLSSTITLSQTFSFTFKAPELIYLPVILKGEQ